MQPLAAAALQARRLVGVVLLAGMPVESGKSEAGSTISHTKARWATFAHCGGLHARLR